MADITELAAPFAPLAQQEIGTPTAVPAPDEGELILPVPANASDADGVGPNGRTRA